jgi:hypothetical protein
MQQKNLKMLEIHTASFDRLEICRGKLWVVLVLHLQLLLIHPMELGFKAF